MVSYTSTLIDARAQRLDRYRRPVSLSPVFGSAKGDLCLARRRFDGEADDDTSPMSWQHVTTIHNSIVFDGFGFDQVTDDTRLGPPPPRRPSV